MIGLPSGKEKRLFKGINLFLAALVVFLVICIGAMLYDDQTEPVAPAASRPASGSSADRVETVPSYPSSRDQHPVQDRKLPSPAAASATDAKLDTADIDGIEIAGKELGMKLIGTIVARDRQLNYAVIEMVREGKQAIFRENDRVEGVLIKQIFRNNVIIVTSSGEQRLTTGQTSATSAKTTQGESQAIGVNIPEVPGAGAEDKEVTLEIPRGEIAEYLPGIGQMLNESISAPNISEGKPDGFAVGRLRAHDLLFRIGLRTGDVIQEVNGEQIDSQDDVESLIQRMASGGQFSVVIKRLGQEQQLNLSAN